MTDATIPKIMYDYAKSLPPKKISRISPSQLGRCHRTHFYAIKGLPQTTPPNPGALLNFQVGFLWEKVLEDALSHSGITYASQVPLYDPELNLEGTADFIVGDEDIEVWDSKTEGMKAQMYRKREGKSFFQAHPEYVTQLAAYALLIEKVLGRKVSRGRFGIIIKDNGLVMEDIVNFTPQVLAATRDRIQTLNNYLSIDSLPPCECDGWKKDWCNYGNPATTVTGSTGKTINTSCCPTIETLKQWSQPME